MDKKKIIVIIACLCVVLIIVFALMGCQPKEDTAVKEAVKAYLLDEDTQEDINVLLERADTLDVVAQDELEGTLIGNIFLEISCDNNYWTLEQYDQKSKRQLAFFEEIIVPKSRGFEDDSDKNWIDDISIENGCIVIEEFGKPKEGELLGDLENHYFQMRKVCDDVYILYQVDDSGNIVALDQIMINYKNPIDSKKGLQSAVEDIIVNYLGLELE